MKKLLSLILSLAVIFAGILPVSMVSASAGTDATLKDICFENHSVFGFSSDETLYQNVEQPYRFSRTGVNYPCPAVSVTTTDPNATADISSAINPDITNGWVVTIKVTAADGVTKKTYNLYTKPVGQNMYCSGGSNMETGFESGTATGWKGSNNDTLSVVNTEAYTGSYSMEFIPKDSYSFPIPTDFAQSTNNGVKWLSSYAVKSSMGLHDVNHSGGVASTYIFVDDNGGTIATQADTNTSSLRTFGTLTAKDANGWQRSMRISNGGYAFQGAAATYDANASKKVYYDDFYMGALVISEIKVSGDTYAKLGEESTLNYSASLLNQYGNKGGVDGETVTWRLVNAPEGVSINESTGVVTVADTASEAGDFYVEAQVLNPSYNTLAAGTHSDYLAYCQSKMGGRIKVSLLPANAEAALSDITVNGGGIAGFNSETMEYDIYVPYSYSANNFAFARPVVSVTPIMDGADVEITYPATIADGEKIYIDVKDTTGNLSTRYTLNVKTAGGNLFADGGFETSSKSAYQSGGWASISFDVVADNTGAGNKVLKANGQRDENGFLGALRTATPTYLEPGKTYLNGFMVKLDPDVAEHPGNTFSAGVMSGHDDGSGSTTREQYAGDYFKLSTGENVARTVTLTDSWEKYTAVVSSTRVANVRVGVNMGGGTFNSAKDRPQAYFYYDDMYLGELVIANMALTTDDDTTVQSGAESTVALNVALENQYGNTQGITNTVSYAVINNHQGVSVADDGTVTIAEDAAAGTAVIEATVIPTWSQPAQPYVKQRIALTIIPKNGFVYSAATISAGDIVTTLNYTAQETAELMFITALYEVVDGELVFNYCEIDDSISLTAGQFISKDLTLTVPNTGTYRIKSFLFEKGTLKPMLNTVGTLGQ